MDLFCVIVNGTIMGNNFFSRLKNKCRRTLYKQVSSEDIVIGKTTRIAKTAIIEIRGGGSIKIGEHSEILDGVMILTQGGAIEIGNNSSINVNSIIYGHGGLKIGNNVLIAGGTMVIPNNHNFILKDKTIIEQGCTAKGIIIGDDVWIGHGCTILDGITLAEGTVVGAGSVVNKSTEPYSVIAGIPARIIKYRK
ncbi:MAG TPA: acyltransferase [Cytophagaceae bacterium]|jgi:acetyltransferase-like isoleucine patch superfamily enzyme|nr:acyltransferase [Cytophagaceae bacterium]